MGDNVSVVKDSVILNVNPQLYALDTVYSAAYVFLDRAYILLDGDPKKKIIVKLKPKGVEDLEKLGMEFLNELINYSDYQRRAEQTKKIREILLQRALITNDPSVVQDSVVKDDGKSETDEFDEVLKELEDDEDCLDDPEGIAIPWEEKYGKKAKSKSKNKPK